MDPITTRLARRSRYCAGAALATLALAMPAFGQAPVQGPPASAASAAPQGGAQQSTPAALPDPAATLPTPQSQAAEAPAQTPADIVVTGTRITTSGFSAPTPTQVLSAAAIAKNAQPNVFTTIAQLPSLQGSSGATVGTNSTSSGTQGLSSFSLRGLGTIRTLTLLDGQRVVGANVTGVPDVSLFPQLLIQRVDVVTGGASASYGSDAVGGVVNFVTNKRFEGFKANALGGVTKYGDDGNYTFQAAAGKSFLNDRLHVVVSGEYSHEDGVPAYGFGEGPGPNGRSWYDTETLVNRGVLNDGSPQYLYREHVQANQYTKYGLIAAGPLQGIAFDKNGRPFNFNYGSNGVPLKDAKGNVSNCYNGFCVGGDLSGNVGNGTSLQSELTRWDGYGRVGFDLDPDNEIYATVNIARVRSSNTPNPGAAKQGNLTIQCSNPFVPAEIQAACAANGITSFAYGVSNAVLPNFTSVQPTRTQYRFVGGADGKFNLFGSDWRYDAYYEHGENITNIHVRDITLTPHYNAAIQAVLGPNGQIICANPAAVASGCQPLNIIGGDTPSAATLAYVTPINGPYQHTRQTQDAASLSFNGAPVSLWAGPLSVAIGAEFRREYYRVNADPYGNGVTASNPYTAAYPADPLVNSAGNNWYAGNYHDGHGSYKVYEGFLELNLPLLDSHSLGKANLNLAGRATHYSTSGTVYTWKIGGGWQTPIDGVKLRAVTSRDVRAPNLSELFAAPIAVTVPNINDPFNNRSISIIQNSIGNTALKPEIARNTEAGIVLSRPAWAPGLSLSFDYYRIKLKGVISALGAQQEINLCSQGVTQTCSAFDLSGSGPYIVNVQSFNLASIYTDGFDIEASYQFPLEKMGLPGNFTVRALATNVRHFITDTGIPGTVPIDSAGANSGATPKWKLLGVESWDTDKFSITFTQRWFSDGTFGNQYIVCQTNCPASTESRPTIDYNKMPGAFYFDIGGSYNLTKKLTAYFKIDNLFDHDPAGSPQTNTGIDVNPQLYDVLGRMYRAGIRYNF
ncbi:TonB-dependent receptor plug domain-containing protein [Sphingomonas morindae]|uniref:TonB-dependent receptor n=1 Tax=Sphingomonas morindae TaxID=1541170 RepID=A0ABY4X536_9SPHN|nr:TonB-dependent receptor [Sphingomonas morindae]USI71975.1 TonB-dependent receptor [Sphingomonas morindae]